MFSSKSHRRALQGMAVGALTVLTVGACAPLIDSSLAKPLLGPPVTDNVTPYSVCLAELAKHPGLNRPTVAVGNITDKTGKRAYDSVNDSTEVTQGASEMVISAFYKTRQVNLTERLDPRIALAEQQLVQTALIREPIGKANVAPAHFLVLGAVTELNYNIHSGGERLFVYGVGASRRAAVINVGIDLRLVDMRSLGTVYVTSLQKQIVGVEYEAGIFRFFGDLLVELDVGQVRNEPLQLGVRSVVELAVYQILTEGLGLPSKSYNGCEPGGEYPKQPNQTNIKEGTVT
jgi:holdfast attachment protein HfaB